MRCPAIILMLVLLLPLPPAVHGQEKVTIRGQVIDSDSREPLQGVLVTTTLAARSVLTDSAGAFSFTLIRDRGYDLVAEDMGYFPRRVALGPEADESLTVIPLSPNREMLDGLATLEERLAQRRRGRSARIRFIRHDSLLVSTEMTAYDLVRRSVRLARACRERPEQLCMLSGGSRERIVRICIDDVAPAAGAAELQAYEPADLWLVEVYPNGSRVRVYSRWFVDRLARSKQGLITLNPSC